MPIVIQHGVSPFVSGLAAFRSGRAQADRATRERNIQTSLTQQAEFGRNLRFGIAELGRYLRQQRGQRDVMERMELGQEQRLEQQRDSILQRSIQEQMARDQKIQALAPHRKIQYFTREQHMLNLASDPEFLQLPREEQDRMFQPMVQANRMLLQTVQPPPTFEERMERSTRIYEDLGIMLYEERPGITKARALNREKADQFSLAEWEEMLETAEGDAFDELKQLEKDHKETLDFVGGLSETDMKRIAKKRAMERVDAKIDKFLNARKRRRQGEGVPPAAAAVRQAQQQQQQQGQLVAQQQVRARVEAQAPPAPIPAVQEVERVFNRGARELATIVQQVRTAGGNPDQPETWNDFQLHNAKGAARDVLNVLRERWPRMSQEEKMQVVGLLELATKINKLDEPIEGA